MRIDRLVSFLAAAALTAGAAVPIAAQATLVDIGVCVVQEGTLREMRAQYDTSTGDTTVAGRPFSGVHRTTTPPYAAGAAWYINSGPFTYQGNRYVKYGLPRVLGVTEVSRVGHADGIPIFSEAGGSAPYEVLYVPVRPGCEFQPYQMEIPTDHSADGRIPVRVVESDEMRIGAEPETLGIEEIRFTSRTTEVLLRFYSAGQPYSGRLHAPGGELAMFLRDGHGNEYELMDQEGWLGPEAAGFGSYTVPADTERLVILYFEPVFDPAGVNRLDLVEGDCAEGCWHFYDIRLQDR